MTEPDAAEQLVLDHLPVVGRVVRDTLARVPAQVSRDDLTAAGLAALAQAARSFDPERGVTFGAYAAIRVRGAVLDELRAVDWASRSVRRKARALAQARSDLTAALGREPTSEEVSASSGLSAHEVRANDDDVHRARVLSLHVGENTAIEELVETREPSPEQLLEQAEQLRYLAAAIEVLPERLRIVVRDYYLEERPMAAIAEELGVTDSRVSQMRAEALGLLRDALADGLGAASRPRDAVDARRRAGVAQRRRESYVAAVAARHAARHGRRLPAVG